MIRSRKYVLWHTQAVEAETGGSRSESRFNPNHGKDGKFTTGPDASGHIDVEGSGKYPELSADELQYLVPASAAHYTYNYDAALRLREKLVESEAGKVLVPTTDELQSTTHRFRHVLDGSEMAGGADEASLHLITQGMADYGKNHVVPDLYRGIRNKENVQYKTGDEFDLALASFSDDRIAASNFAGLRGSGKSVVFTLKGSDIPGEGPAALPIMNLSTGAGLYSEREYLSNGHFRIASVKETPSQTMIELEQVKNYVAI